MFKRYVHFLAPLLLSIAGCSLEEEIADNRPNIIYILVDDMGYSDLGCYGSEINTPNIDRLAFKGMRFTKFYNAARCCPSRASLLTGLYPHLAGMGSMTQDFGHPSYQGNLGENTTTIAEVLGNNGYHTYQVGKWHVGDARKDWPDKKGFEQHFTFLNGASSYYNLQPYRVGGDSMKMAWNGKPFRPGEDFYMTDAFSDHAVDYIDQNEDKPFFMYLAYTAPHWPLHALPEDIARYKGKYRMGWDSLRLQRWQRMKSLQVIREDTPLSERSPDLPAWEEIAPEDRATWDTRMALYAAVIDRMDQGIGRIIQKLEEKGELENTLIAFLSDNGGSPERMLNTSHPTDGEPGSATSFPTYWAHWANVSNTPFRFYKGWVQEGGIATPFIVHWPSTVPEGAINTGTIGHIMDLLPTALDAANVTYPAEIAGRQIIPTTGESLLPAVRGETQAGHETLFWEHEGARAVRQGDWKLVANNYDILSTSWKKNGQWRLFNLKDDPAELNDVLGENVERAEELKLSYEEWEKSTGVLSPQEFVEMKTAFKKRQAQK
ncbi:MAG: arylsulfatase [Saprospiraceae bacterium]|nr:arylsulfatase [Saprospiraceae bacterium]